jgi:hypothetical protein
LRKITEIGMWGKYEGFGSRSEHDLEDGKLTSLIMVISSGLYTPYGVSRGRNRPLRRVDVGVVGGENVRRVRFAACVITVFKGAVQSHPVHPGSLRSDKCLLSIMRIAQVSSLAPR